MFYFSPFTTGSTCSLWLYSKMLRYFLIPCFMFLFLFNVFTGAQLRSPDCSAIPRTPRNYGLLNVIWSSQIRYHWFPNDSRCKLAQISIQCLLPNCHPHYWIPEYREALRPTPELIFEGTYRDHLIIQNHIESSPAESLSFSVLR